MATIRPMSFGDVANVYMRSSPTLIDGNPWAGAASEIAKLIESAGDHLTTQQVASLLTIGCMAYHEAMRREGEKGPSAPRGGGTAG